MKHLTVLGILLRLHVFIFILLILGVLLYAVGGFQGFLASTQSTLLTVSQYLGIAGVLSGLYVAIAAIVAAVRGRHRVWHTVLGVLLSSAFCAAVALVTLFLHALIVTA